MAAANFLLPLKQGVEAVLQCMFVQQLTAGNSVNLRAQRRNAILIGIAHFRLARIGGEHQVVTEEQVGRCGEVDDREQNNKTNERSGHPRPICEIVNPVTARQRNRMSGPCLAPGGLQRVNATNHATPPNAFNQPQFGRPVAEKPRGDYRRLRLIFRWRCRTWRPVFTLFGQVLGTFGAIRSKRHSFDAFCPLNPLKSLQFGFAVAIRWGACHKDPRGESWRRVGPSRHPVNERSIFDDARKGGKQKAARGRRSWARGLAWFGGTLILVLIIVVAGALFLVSRGPVELSAIRSMAEKTIAEQIAGGADIRVGSGSIAFEGSYDPIVILEDIEIAGPDGAYSGRANRVVLSVPLDNALGGDFRPNIADGDGLAIRLAMPAMRMTAQSDDGTSPLVGQAQLESLHRHLADIAAMVEDIGIKRVSLTNSRVEVSNSSAPGLVAWRLSDLDGEMRVDAAGALSLSLSGSGRSGRWSAAVSRTSRDGGGTNISVTASDLTWTDLVSEERHAAMSQIPKMPVYPQLEAAFSETGDLLTAQLLMTLGAGYVVLGREDAVLLDEATVRVEWDRDKRRFVVHPSAFHLGETALNIGGFINPPRAIDGPWGIFFGIRDAQFRPKDVEGPPINQQIDDRLIRFASSQGQSSN